MFNLSLFTVWIGGPAYGSRQVLLEELGMKLLQAPVSTKKDLFEFLQDTWKLVGDLRIPTRQ